MKKNFKKRKIININNKRKNLIRGLHYNKKISLKFFKYY